MINQTEFSFMLILHAGNAKSSAMEAIELARGGDFENAELNIKEAEEELLIAHKEHAKLLQLISSGEQNYAEILLVHAQDHFSLAMSAIEMAQEFIHIYKIILNLGGK